jgi:hypothetical protein
MSQVETATAASQPKDRKQRFEEFLKNFEWNWTKATIASFAIVGFLLIFAVVIPSFWMYFAEQTLGWGGPTDIEAALRQPFDFTGSPLSAEHFLWLSGEMHLQVRDAVVMGLSTIPLVLLLVVASIMQNWRRKLRGHSDNRPTGGYR